MERDDVRIRYDLEGRGPGEGSAVLLIAPGGMQSANDFWNRMPWNPRTALGDRHRIIGMDQRNAGGSTAPISADDGWATYLADQLALLDDLGVDECHVVGMCIGGPYIAALLKAAPERFRSAVMLQPVGIDGNRQAFYDMFDSWSSGLAESHPDMADADWASFRSNMWDGEFLLTVSADELASIATPIMVLMGDDMYHPESTSREIAAVGSNVTFVERWKDDDVLGQTSDTIRAFLQQHD